MPFNYQGKITDSAGAAVSGPYSLGFSLYDVPAGGLPIGALQLPTVQVTAGIFSVALDFGNGAFDGQPRWIEVTIGDQPPLPRQPITAAPYALFALAPWSLAGNDLVYLAGNVGIGAPAPEARLEVAGDIKLSGEGSALIFPDGTRQTTAALDASFGVPSGFMIFGNTTNAPPGYTFTGEKLASAIGGWSPAEVFSAPPPALNSPATTVVNSRLYMFGGFISGVGYSNDLWFFDNGTWAKLAASNPPTARVRAAAGAINGRIYFFGGAGSSGNVFGDTWVFDTTAPLATAWSQLTPSGTKPTVRTKAAAGVIGGKLYLFGGTAAGVYYNDTFAYDPAANSWTLLSLTGTPAAGRADCAAAVVNDKLYIFGGISGPDMLNELWVFDPAANTWTQLNAATTPLRRRQAAGAAVNGKFVIFGGYNTGAAYLNDTWQYDPSAGEWTSIPPGTVPPSARIDPAAGTINNELVLFGGSAAGSLFFSDTWRLHPPAFFYVHVKS